MNTIPAIRKAILAKLPAIADRLVITRKPTQINVLLREATGCSEKDHPEGKTAGKKERLARSAQHWADCEAIRQITGGIGSGNGYNLTIISL